MGKAGVNSQSEKIRMGDAVSLCQTGGFKVGTLPCKSAAEEALRYDKTTQRIAYRSPTRETALML